MFSYTKSKRRVKIFGLGCSLYYIFYVFVHFCSFFFLYAYFTYSFFFLCLLRSLLMSPTPQWSRKDRVSAHCSGGSSISMIDCCDVTNGNFTANAAQ